MKPLIVSLLFISTFGLGQSFVTIAEARALAVGTNATVRGIVTTPNYQTTNTEYGLQDATAGITIFLYGCLLYTSPSPRDLSTSRMPSSA